MSLGTEGDDENSECCGAECDFWDGVEYCDDIDGYVDDYGVDL